MAVRVVIPAYGACRTLPACLQALCTQDNAAAFDVVVVRDREPGQAVAPAAGAGVREIPAPRHRNAAAARNEGAREQSDGILVFVDADVVLEPGSLARLVAPILDGTADASVGNYSTRVDGLTFFQRYKQLYVSAVYSRRAGFIRNEFWTGLCAVRAIVFHAIGGFNEKFSGAAGEDTEFGQRLTRGGYRIFAVPDARAQHLHEFTFRGVVRNDFRKGIQSALNGFRNRSLRDHRHSSTRDVVAVALAWLAAAAAVLTLAAGRAETSAVLLLTMLCWAMSRWDLWKTWSVGGSGFLIRCVPVAYVLDVLRGVCVLVAVGGYLQERARERRVL